MRILNLKLITNWSVRRFKFYAVKITQFRKMLGSLIFSTRNSKAIMKHYIVLALLFVPLVGCTSKSEEFTKREYFFEDNLEHFKTNAKNDDEVVGILKKYREFYEQFDIDNLSKIISDEFSSNYYFKDFANRNIILIQDRNEYFEKRKSWRNVSGYTQKLEMFIKSITHNEDTGYSAVIAGTTYRSKYFNPRFLETFVMRNAGDGFKIVQHIIFPMYPPKPEMHEVEIFFADVGPEYLSMESPGFQKEFNVLGPDLTFERHVRRLSKRAPGKAVSQKAPIVIFFREPPPEGSQISIIETQIGGNGNSFYNEHIVNLRGNPYLILSGAGWHGRRYSVSVEVRLDGVRVANEILQLPK